MAIHTVALIGANGILGPTVLSALQSSPMKVTVLNRASSKTKYPANIDITTIPDDFSLPELTAALKGVDALVITIAGSHVKEQKALIEASWNAGVKRVIPAEFGSCDSADPETVELLPLMKGKQEVRGYLEEWCEKEREGDGGNMTWTSLVTGHFFDYGLKGELLKFDVKNRKVWLIDDGDVKFSATTLPTIGRAVVKVLTEHEKETENKLLYIHSFCVSQKEVLASLEKATVDKFDVVEVSGEELIKEARPKMLGGDHQALEEVVAVHGIVASDWRQKLDNDLIGLPEESLHEVVKKVVEELK
ncbi:NAD(P)-binding protein [Delitschia confertaspora ATCC 74209]|uniref:NAD(P)-binding protein n=1 Tax=Delitschia confertaspora ATCC 74209 TaxID=1513339 RepID=A0A9P4MVK1_9PLEO|nr:NAD(P)-binding protein [Delitschia confertaspora ATCC 74209]